MKKIALLIFSVFSLLGFSQNAIRGVVFNEQGIPLPGVQVTASHADKETYTDADGFFSFQVLAAQTLTFFLDGYEPFRLVAAVGDEISVSLQPIGFEKKPYQDVQLNIINLSDDEISDENDALDNISGLLQSTQDVFLRTAAFEFSASFFRVRGLDSDHATLMINGLPMNKLFNGRPQWSNWGGLNDVLRNRELSSGIAPSDYLVGGVMGTTNINTRASDYGKGGRLTFSSSDRSYNYRVLASYGTGQLKNGWSGAVALGNRWGTSGFQQGTFYDAQSLFVAVEKEWTSHSLNATLIATPNRRGKSSPNTQEVYDLKGIRYNEYWGNQSGEVRNSRVKRIVEPIVMLNHRWTVSPKTTLRTNLGFQFGEVGNSRLDYPSGANPSPSYYQKLPSYFLTQSGGADYEGAYRHEQDFRQNGQLDWNRLYDANRNTKTAAYALYEDRNDDTQLTANTILRSELNDNITLIGTLQHRSLKSENFAEILDLLGTSGYLNVDAYDGTQFDLNDPDRIAGVGDKIRYHYTVDAAINEASAIARFNYPKISGYAAVCYAATQYQREGKYKHEAYPDSSFGKSKKLSFGGGSLKAGLTYNIKNRHWLQANAALIQRAPSLRNSFSNARETHAVVGEQASRPLKTERISAADLSYIFRSPHLNARLTGFYTQIEDANEISFFFAEGIGGDASSFVQEIMQGTAKRHQGIEFGIEGAITPSLKLKGAAALGDYRYANNPHVYLTSDDFEYLDFGTAKMKNLRLASGPQEAYSLGVEFRENFWWFGLTANYFDHTYLDVSPINRTQNFLLDRDGLPFPNYDPDQARILLQQEKFDPYTVVNMVVGKSWRMGKRFVGAFLSVNNVLNQTYKTGGFEQSRNANYITLLEDVRGAKRRFGPKYWYGRGATYFLNTYIRF
jgi:hypothetical protein